MKIFKKITAILLAAIMTIPMAVPVFAAAAAPTDISIKQNTKTMYVGQTIELDSRIRPTDDGVRDRDIRWSSSNSKVIKVLKKRDDDTKIKALKAGKATITVRIAGTNLNATKTITVKKNKSATSSVKKYTNQINTQNKKAKAIEKKMRAATVAATYQGRVSQAASYEKQLKAIEKKLDALEDTIEYKYDSGKLSASQYRKLERKIEKVEDYISNLEDYIEGKFGDFDD